MGLNRLEILGRIGRIDQLRQTGGGKDVLGFSVGKHARFRDAFGPLLGERSKAA